MSLDEPPLRARNIGAGHGTSVQIINPGGMVYRAPDLTGVLDALTRPTHLNHGRQR